jgi:hypothetical protein
MPDTDRQPFTSPDEAMNIALQAEQRALEGIASCEKQAEQILQQGRERTRHILARAEQRVEELHLRCARLIDAQTEQLNRLDESDRKVPAAETWSRSLLDGAIDRLAGDLTTLPAGEDTGAENPP